MQLNQSDQPLERIDHSRSRGRVRTRAQSRTLERAMTLPNIPESISLDQQEAEQTYRSQALPYQLRRNRAPRYRRGTCGSRNCSCVKLVEVRTPDKRLAPGADAPAQDLVDTEVSETIHNIKSCYSSQTPGDPIGTSYSDNGREDLLKHWTRRGPFIGNHLEGNAWNITY